MLEVLTEPEARENRRAKFATPTLGKGPGTTAPGARAADQHGLGRKQPAQLDPKKAGPHASSGVGRQERCEWPRTMPLCTQFQRKPTSAKLLRATWPALHWLALASDR